jgi:hypothetical protein
MLLSQAITNAGGELVHKRYGTISSGSAFVLNLAAAGLVGMAHVLITVPSGATVKVELSRDGSSYSQYPAGVLWPAGPINVAIPFESVSPVTHVRITRMTGSGNVDYAASDGPIAWYAIQQTAKGQLDVRPLVVDSGTRDYLLVPTTDAGVTFLKTGVDNDTVTIPNEISTPWVGYPFFGLWRHGNGLVEANPPANSLQLADVPNQAARLGLSSAVVGNAVKQADNGLHYVLMALPASSNPNWTAHPAGTNFGVVTIYNKQGVETVEDGGPVAYVRMERNLFVKVG